MSSPNQFSLNEALSLGVQQAIQPISWTNGISTQPSIEPRPLDILCGKSKRCVDHGGSRRFRTVIECYREKYQQALTKWDKTSVTRTIYDNLSQAGSRFLKYNEAQNFWEEISPMAARDKIGHALRFANRLIRRKRNADCIGSKAILPTRCEPAAATAKPQPLQVLGNASLPSLPAKPLTPQQPLNLQVLPPLGCISAEIRSMPQVLQGFGFASAPTQAQTPAQSSAIPSLSSPLLGQLQAPGMLTQSLSPLNRQSLSPLNSPKKWYQHTEAPKVDTLKVNAKPAAAAASLDDSSSLRDDIFPLLQNAPEPFPASNDNLAIDSDFDAEILSVLF